MSDLTSLQQSEMDLWNRWNRGDDEALPPLMKSLRPIIHQWTNRISSSNLPKSYLESRVKRHVVDSMKKYDPNRGAKLSTFINSRMRKVHRDIYPYQNIGQIPEHRITKIQTFQSVKNDLEEKYNRPASYMELSDALHWSIPEIERMDRELRADVASTDLSEEYSVLDDSDTAESLGYVYHSLTPKTRLVFENMFGWGGQAKMKPGEIQTKFKMTPSEYRTSRQEIIDRIEEAM